MYFAGVPFPDPFRALWLESRPTHGAWWYMVVLLAHAGSPLDGWHPWNCLKSKYTSLLFMPRIAWSQYCANWNPLIFFGIYPFILTPWCGPSDVVILVFCNWQVPFLFGVTAFEKAAGLVIHWIFRRTGRHLFLTDGDEGKPPLLKRLVEDSGECQFMYVT